MTRRQPRPRGATLVEFAIVMPVAMLLVFGILQLGLMLVARRVLDAATQDGARRGAVEAAQPEVIRAAIVARLAVLYQPVAETSAERRIALGLARAAADLAPGRLEVERLSPTPEAFRDFGIPGSDRIAQIPNHLLEVRPPLRGTRSGMTLHEANVLRVRATWSFRLDLPLMPALYRAAMCGPFALADAGDCARHYALGRVPLVAHATVMMHSAARER